jgi:tripartite-type tricarboxylate transporter receptor subunit TctC
MARMMQAAIQKNNLMKQPVIVSLKGGASGAEALMYMKGSDGDPNKVLIAYSLIYMLPLSAKIPFNWRDLTPVSVIAMDQFVLWDNANGPKTVKDFIAAAKASSTPFKMGGTGSKREDHVLTVFMEKKTGAKFSYLPYKSGGEAATQLVGNHTESNVNNPSEESRSLARRPGSRALRVRQGAHLLQDQGHRNAVVERHPDLQGRRPRHAVPDAARDVPSRQGDAGADRILRRSVQEGDADPNTRNIWRSRP